MTASRTRAAGSRRRRTRTRPSGVGQRSQARRAILDATQSLLVEGGYEAFSMRRLAERCGYTAPTIYHHFGDKPGLIGALGTTLGDAELNIATFHLGRAQPGGEALALIELDQAIPPDVLAKVRALPHIRQATPLEF